MAEKVRVQELATLDVTIEPGRPRIVAQYWATGSNLWGDVSLACLRQDAPPAGHTRIPIKFRGLPRASIDYKFEGGTLWTVTVNFGYLDAAGGYLGTPTSPPDQPPGVSPPTSPPPPADGDLLGREWNVSTVGGTVKKVVSENTRVSRSVPGYAGAAPSFNRAFNVGKEGVQGCEVAGRKLEITITRTVPGVTMGYIRDAFALTGTVNNAAYLGFAGNAAGLSELLFTGIEARGKDDGAWTVTWHFAASPNRDEELFPGDGNRQWGGWDFVWYVFKDDVSNGFPVHTPLFAYVEQVYKVGDFTKLRIFG